MYKDMYDTFDDKCIPYSYPFSFQEDRKEYMEGTKPTYTMDYGDTVIIPFQIGCKYVGYYINIIVYNSRFEEVYCESSIPDNTGKVYLNITDEVSNKIFKKGHYYIQVQAEGYVQMMVQVSTLIPAECCTIFVR